MTTGAAPSVVVLVRAWRDDDGVRGVVTLEGREGAVHTVAAASVEGLCAVVREALWRWAGDGGPGGAPASPEL